MADEIGKTKNSGKNNSQKHRRPKFDVKRKFHVKKNLRQLEDAEITRIKDAYKEMDVNSFTNFKDIPLSERTQKGLHDAGYTDPTDIQKQSVGIALQGNDVLGAAKTGSGKTLAFLIPVLECLFCLKWSSLDGLGALIITPTRELAYQIFEVLRKVGKYHDFSAGLVIGGKDLKSESEQIPRTNIVICTPGRLLQHLDETVFFKADSVQMLVLDEADRMLDLGFAAAMNAIVENLPRARQTLLFSATQTKSVKDLARLSLDNPMYVSVHEHAAHATPEQLAQSYTVCEQHDKLSLLWSFVRNHQRQKVLVFMQSCKQVRYYTELLKRLKAGVAVLCLHGAMTQLKRVAAYQTFCRKQHAVLVATDVAARGLDFPAVNWVVQLDCPEDANTYIHRAGRTARYQHGGEALLVLTSSEKDGMLRQLEEKKIPITMIKVNPKKLWSVQGKVQSFVASDIALKENAKGAFMAYVKSVHLMSNKDVFNVKNLDTDKYAHSLGLAVAPRVRFLQKEEKRRQGPSERKEMDGPDLEELLLNSAKGDIRIDSRQSHDVEASDEDESESESDSESEESGSTDSEAEVPVSGDERGFSVADDDLEDILVVKKKGVVEAVSDEESNEENEKRSRSKETVEKQSKYQVAKKLIRKNIKVNTKVTFDDDGTEVVDRVKTTTTDLGEDDGEREAGGIDIELAKQRLSREDQVDKELWRARVKAMHRERRLKERERRRANNKRDEQVSSDGEGEAVLSGGEGEADLSWLPDPDKVYGHQGGGEGTTDDEGNSPPAKKVRHEREDEESLDEDGESDSGESSDSGSSPDDGESDDDSKSEGDAQLGTSRSLQDDEDLALKLLMS